MSASYNVDRGISESSLETIVTDLSYYLVNRIVKIKSCNFLIPGSLEYFVNAALQSHTIAPSSILTVAYWEAMLLSSLVLNTSLLLYDFATFKKRRSGANFVCPAIKKDT